MESQRFPCKPIEIIARIRDGHLSPRLLPSVTSGFFFPFMKSVERDRTSGVSRAIPARNPCLGFASRRHCNYLRVHAFNRIRTEAFGDIRALLGIDVNRYYKKAARHHSHPLLTRTDFVATKSLYLLLHLQKPRAMESKDLRELAESLRHARLNRTPIAPPAKTYPKLDEHGAFEVQRISVDLAVANGDRLVGYKLGNIAKAMQDAFGLDKPDHGFLLASTFLYEGTKISLSDFVAPFVELEPAFVLKGSLKGPNVTAADVISAIDYAIPAIEIIDSRVKDWEIGLEDTLADNGSTGAVILGGTPRRLTDLYLSDMRGYLKFNGEEIMAGNTKNILGNPINAVAWLVNRLAQYDVEMLPGQIIMPGSCLEAMRMDKKGHWSCTYEGWGTIDFDVE